MKPKPLARPHEQSGQQEAVTKLAGGSPLDVYGGPEGPNPELEDLAGGDPDFSFLEQDKEERSSRTVYRLTIRRANHRSSASVVRDGERCSVRISRKRRPETYSDVEAAIGAVPELRTIPADAEVTVTIETELDPRVVATLLDVEDDAEVAINNVWWRAIGESASNTLRVAPFDFYEGAVDPLLNFTVNAPGYPSPGGGAYNVWSLSRSNGVYFVNDDESEGQADRYFIADGLIDAIEVALDGASEYIGDRPIIDITVNTTDGFELDEVIGAITDGPVWADGDLWIDSKRLPLQSLAELPPTIELASVTFESDSSSRWGQYRCFKPTGEFGDGREGDYLVLLADPDPAPERLRQLALAEFGTHAITGGPRRAIARLSDESQRFGVCASNVETARALARPFAAHLLHVLPEAIFELDADGASHRSWGCVFSEAIPPPDAERIPDLSDIG